MRWKKWRKRTSHVNTAEQSKEGQTTKKQIQILSNLKMEIETLKKETKAYLAALPKELLDAISAKSVRRYLETKFETSLAERKREIDEMVLDCFTEISQQSQSSPIEPVSKVSKHSTPSVKPSTSKPDSPKPRTAAGQSLGSSESEMSEVDASQPLKRKRNTGGGWAKPWKLSPDLQFIINDQPTQQFLLQKDGIQPSEEQITHLGRPTITKYLWGYIKSHNLQDPNDGRMVICDEAFKKVMGKDEISSFQMAKELGAHLTKDDSYVAPPRPEGERLIKRQKVQKEPRERKAGGGWAKALPMSESLCAIVDAAYV